MCRLPSELFATVLTQSLRPPEVVMKLERLGSFHSSRLSFTRSLVRRMHQEKWHFQMIHNTLDELGHGCLIYQIQIAKSPVSFIAFSSAIDDTDRTDRVIAEKWDMCFTLFNGIPNDEDIKRLSRELPRQEAGRLSRSEIVMSRANKSVRIFNKVVDCLAMGHQPKADDIANIGYLIRTTAVYGNGKFGLMNFHHVKKFTPFEMPFQAEMLTVYMARQLSIDLVEHIARQRGLQQAVALSKPLRRIIGVGNATGLGMAPFLVSHPQLIDRWITVRETAIEITKSKCEVTHQQMIRFKTLVERVSQHLQLWQTDDPRQSHRLSVLRREMAAVLEFVSKLRTVTFPWRHLAKWANENTSLECQELLNSLFLEIYPEEINELDQLMGVDEWIRYNPAMQISELKNLIEKRYVWAIGVDFTDPDAQHYFWYVSQEKEEPRRGQRHLERGTDLEIGVGIAKDVNELYRTICNISAVEHLSTVADLLRVHPNYRAVVMRIQSLVDCKYGEIQENLLDKHCLPINLLRCKLAIFGATNFDPKSDLWTRITLFQGAPMYDELSVGSADDWAFPVVPAVSCTT